MNGNNEMDVRKLSVLIVDDKANIRTTLSYCLRVEGHAVSAVSNIEDALWEVKRQFFDLAYVDLRLGSEDGLALITSMQKESPWTKIVVITAYASVESAVESMRRGATDYIAKPFTPPQVRMITNKIARIRAMETEINALKQDIERHGPQERLMAESAAMSRIVETAKKAASSEAIILLRGESGTGKSVLAKAIHNWSERKNKSFVVVACPAIPADLLESELFGHAKGAFTGATRDYPGRIAACEGGTLFLDEIGEMAPPVQAKLLRFIQDKEYERLGETVSRQADIRLLAATNAKLEERVNDGSFREDLYYRLNVISLIIPPLRERPEDIMVFAQDFLNHFRNVNHKTIFGFSKRAESALIKHNWPGNVRELRNIIERAVILSAGDRISVNDLPEALCPVPGEPALGDLVSLESIIEQHIRRVLAKTGTLQEAADILGIDQATLWRKRKHYGI